MTTSPIPRLDDLIAAIESKAPDPLEQLTAAVLVAQHIDELADHLIGHFVDRARRAGASWTHIGQSLGVTKQAAQKRFVPTDPETAEVDLRIFARYTDRARAAIVRAQQLAQESAATEIRPGHILLALLEDEHTHQFLGAIDRTAVRTALTDTLGTGTGAPAGRIPFAPASRKALELGHREAVRRNDNHIDPKHILLGLLSMTDEPDIAATAPLGLDRQQVEARISTEP
ncbi:MAG TPA: Clp protease N-terminal domain-containing protein [Actinophytocola sp.]|uniref:Clp protease N-terminal domain-containing protein n=1 Tax=Actinophytocola sp. TaxID=1872138 RepID=UPI002DDD9E78|nr:Clp protease N-terminal domain-containing protein [Actinophytocola sp.]HEV2778786.1 Clp protease N-terminal domain-containing protein [Actinophytocola sp.]